MKDRIRTLLIGAQGYGTAAIKMDTSHHLFLKRIHTGAGNKIFGGYDKSFTGKGISYTEHRYETLSYARDWEDAFFNHHEVQADFCNITDLLAFRRHMQLIKEYDLIVILHSAAGDDMKTISRASNLLRKRRGKLVIFFGNEYDLMDEKISFANRSQADFVCSQLPQETADWLYAGVKNSKILEVPHALNPSIYYPDSSIERPYDLGFAGAFYHSTIGDIERTRFIQNCSELGPLTGLEVRIHHQNFARPIWAKFMRMSKAIIGAESGTYYLQRSGEAIRKALRYQKENPEAQFNEVFNHAFANITDYHNGKCISSRHFEPIGTRTCQFLLEGNYNGILKPYEHYIPVKADYSNAPEAIALLKDESFREKLADRTLEYVMDCHTYAKRVENVLHLTVGL